MTSNHCSLEGWSNSDEWFEKYYGFFTYAAVLVLYNLLLLTPLGGLVLRAISRGQRYAEFTTMDRMFLRWPRVILGTRQPVLAIQTLRCCLQSSVFFGLSALSICTFAFLMETTSCRSRLIYAIMTILMICSMILYSQHIRFVYHLDFVVTKQPKQHRKLNHVATDTNIIEHAGGVERGAFILSAEKEMSDEDWEKATNEFRHLQLESEMDLDDEALRLAYILHQAALNHNLALRCFFFCTPLVFGLLGDIALAASSAALLIVMIYHDAVFATVRADPDRYSNLSPLHKFSSQRFQ
jgi:hypothetical protein